MKPILRLAAAVAALLVLSVPAHAQNVTLGSISGSVKDAQSGVLPGATVVAVHTPTGSLYEGVTEGDGRFNLLNVRVGGPYEVTISLPGFRPQKLTGITVALGEAADLSATLQLEAVAEVVTVTADASSVFTPSKVGTAENISQAALDTLPSISRSLTDFARTSPFFVQTEINANPDSALSVAGRNTRYNNIQIDGAVNNDVFGLAESGTPGGPAGTQPVSMDAIQELQLVVSPVDVRQAGFSGGGMNAITKSGSNSFKGTGFYYFRDEGLVGDGVDNRPIATFNDKQGGATIGGPIKKNKAFFFGSFEMGRRDTPSGYSISGSSGVSFGRQAEAQRFLDILRTRYNYNPGDLDEYIRATNSDKVLVKADFNLGRSQLTIRHNYVDGLSDIGTQSATTYNFPDNFYRFNSATNTTVAQFNTTFGAAMFNELRFTGQVIRDQRTTATEFPQITVRLPGNANFEAGTENFSAANELDQDVWEITDDLTLVRGQHTIILGTHNEFFTFRNLFIRDNNGSYIFEGLDNLEAGFAQAYDYSFSLTGDPQFPARFKVRQLGFYAGDQWRAANNFTLSYGLRFDTPIFPDKPTANPQSVALYGYATDVVPEDYTLSPRAGFNWNLSEATRQQVRGSIGYFGGRTPYVWLSNQYGNTGIEFRRLAVALNANNRVAFVPDPNNQPTNVGGAASNEIDVIDPEYAYPKTIRGNVAYDRGLPFSLVGTTEFLFSRSNQDIDYENVNLVQTGTRPDGRPFFGRVNTAFSDVILLTNTEEGNAWNLAFKVDKPYRDGWMASGSYMYGRSRTVNDGGSSQARSNWINTYSPGNINAVPLAISNFDPAHRFTMSGSYMFDMSRARLTASLYYNGQSGRPYAYAYNSDVNGDAGFGNDLLYIPRPGEATFVSGTYDDLINFINAGDCTEAGTTVGTIVERNTCRAPWTNRLDFRFAVDIPISKVNTTIDFNLQNLPNLFSSSNGLVEYATFNELQPINAAFNAATNSYTYTVNAVARPGAVRFSRDDLRSRWQGQIGLRVRF